MTTQTTYATNIAPPPPGTVAGQQDNSRETTGICETASPGIPFGRAVSQGVLSDQGAVLGGTLVGLKGCSIRDITVRGDLAVVDAYLPPNSLGILESGDIWVEPFEAVNANDIVVFNLTSGLWGKTTGAGVSTEIPGARWKTSCGIGGRAILSLPGGRAFTATALA
jgi:hypothetical protein